MVTDEPNITVQSRHCCRLQKQKTPRLRIEPQIGASWQYLSGKVVVELQSKQPDAQSSKEGTPDVKKGDGAFFT